MTRPETRFLDRRSAPHLTTLVLLTGLAALSMSVFLPSLPRMATHFDASYQTMQLSVSLYLVVSAALQLFVGPLSDRFGRRPVLLVALGLFLVSTLGIILAPSAEIFLAFRMAQAVIATAFVISRAVVRDMVPGAQAASMIGYVTMGMSLVPMFGPAIGGSLEQFFGWQASFVLLLVMGAVVLALVWFDLGETATRAMGSVSQQITAFTRLMRSQRFWGYAVASAAGSGVFFAFLGGAPYVGSIVFGLQPSALGIWFGVPAVGYVLGNFLSGRFSVRFGINRMVLWGSLVVVVAMFVLTMLTVPGFERPAVFFGLTVFVGIGNGIALPSATSGMMSVRPELAGSAAGLGGAVAIGGGAALSALAGPLLMLGGGALPLALLMLCASMLSLGAILFVIRRNRILGV